MKPSVPDLIVKLDQAGLMAYGGATWDWHRVHYDGDLARQRGLKGPIADGQMFGALIARQIRKWAGPCARFVEMEFRNRRFVTPPNVVTISSQILSSQIIEGSDRVDIVSTIRDQDGQIIVENARTIIEVPK